MPRLVKRPTLGLGSGHDLVVMALWSWHQNPCQASLGACLGFPFSLSLSVPPLHVHACTLSLSLFQNKYKLKKKKQKQKVGVGLTLKRVCVSLTVSPTRAESLGSPRCL